MSVDVAGWYDKPTACALLHIAERTLDHMVEQGRIERRSRPRPGKRPEAVYAPGDVDTLAAAADAPRVMRSEQALAPVPVSGFERGELPPVLSIVLATLDRVAAIAQRPQLPAPQKPQERPASPLPLYLTIPEAALVSGLSAALLRRLCRSGRLGFRDGRAWRIPGTDLASTATISALAKSAQQPPEKEPHHEERPDVEHSARRRGARASA